MKAWRKLYRSSITQPGDEAACRAPPSDGDTVRHLIRETWKHLTWKPDSNAITSQAGLNVASKPGEVSLGFERGIQAGIQAGRGEPGLNVASKPGEVNQVETPAIA